ncbi:hypothetical protein [Streptomyces sp. NPDC051214]|uniref:hypothetical protein n=1 Tax=Streptomyces sp. NPDC051214 TaxID=3155282 RepID=UPI0034293E5D
MTRPTATGRTTGAAAPTSLKTDNARLRRDTRDLTEQLELALAAIQRFSVDNDRLRSALHEARSITPLPRRPR